MSRNPDPGPEGRREQRWRNVVPLAVTGSDRVIGGGRQRGR